MARHAAQTKIQPEALTHGFHCPAKNIHITACVMASQIGLLQMKSILQLIERMSNSTGFTEKHFG
jgi:hypothetical protein